jgi:dihydrofolate reductase
MSISLIVAIDTENGIGYQNKLLCYLPNDLKWFKKNTEGKTVIMGRNTYISLPNGALPNRKNIVISDKITDCFPNCEVVNSIESAISKINSFEENFIIGGASIYKQFLPLADKLYITKIYNKFEADAFFPEIDEDIWKLVEKTDNFRDEKHLYDYSFCIYQKI